jgi:hypothetical protein
VEAASAHPQGQGGGPVVSPEDHERARRFCLEWLGEPYDPDQHPEWLNLARSYLDLERRSRAKIEEANREIAKLRRIMSTPTTGA